MSEPNAAMLISGASIVCAALNGLIFIETGDIAGLIIGTLCSAWGGYFYSKWKRLEREARDTNTANDLQ